MEWALRSQRKEKETAYSWTLIEAHLSLLLWDAIKPSLAALRFLIASLLKSQFGIQPLARGVSLWDTSPWNRSPQPYLHLTHYLLSQMLQTHFWTEMSLSIRSIASDLDEATYLNLSYSLRPLYLPICLYSHARQPPWQGRLCKVKVRPR